jgi:hypothetical protein
MHFRLIVLSHWRVEIQMRDSESGLGAASPARAKHSSEELAECENGSGREAKGLQYDWELGDGKCGEGMLLE